VPGARPIRAFEQAVGGVPPKEERGWIRAGDFEVLAPDVCREAGASEPPAPTAVRAFVDAGSGRGVHERRVLRVDFERFNMTAFRPVGDPRLVFCGCAGREDDCPQTRQCDQVAHEVSIPQRGPRQSSVLLRRAY
jgi:hypothetical protein